MSDNIIDGVHGALAEELYVHPTEPQLLARLEWFQDQKLALMSHWGIYAQLGLIESWALSDDDASWSRKEVDWTQNGVSLKQDYYGLAHSFNPVRFEPEKWAEAAKEGGFKYYVFTTKHHDGFCMWDTQYTDYKITSKNCPFHLHEKADVTKHVFDAFRKQGLGIAAYFSKADWHVPSYWEKDQGDGYHEGFTWRGPTYQPEEKPKLWEEFVTFTQNQVLELVENYGKIDILWFDAGWVNRENGQDIRIEELIEKVRKIQPDIISADRTVGGTCENYITPEQSIPSQPLGVPWESCITMSDHFAYHYDDTYKSTQTLLRMLIDIVAKGGNLALNVSPQPDGRIPEPAILRMGQMGAWLKQYGDAIYGTRVCNPYRVGDFAFTQRAKEGRVFAFYLGGFRSRLVIPFIDFKVVRVVNMTTGEEIPFTVEAEGFAIEGLEDFSHDAYGGKRIADVFELTVE